MASNSWRYPHLLYFCFFSGPNSFSSEIGAAGGFLIALVSVITDEETSGGGDDYAMVGRKHKKAEINVLFCKGRKVKFQSCFLAPLKTFVNSKEVWGKMSFSLLKISHYLKTLLEAALSRKHVHYSA